MVMLRSREGDEFEVEATVAMESQTIKRIIEDDGAEKRITLPNISSRILSRVIEYCSKHVEARGAAAAAGGDAVAAPAVNKAAEDALKSFDADFIMVDKDTLYDLILAADHLKIEGLVNLTCQTVADMIKGKTPEQIRKMFNIPAPSPEEAEEVRRENQWARE